jgi:hypothetical protein
VLACLPPVTVAILYVELEGWHGVSLQGGWLAWFAYVVNGGWFGFLLIRVVLLSLLALVVWRLWRWSQRIGRSLAMLIIIALAVLFVMTSYSPAGIYAYVDELERYGGDHYLRLFGGKAEEVSSHGVAVWGHYDKTADGWILTEMSDRGRHMKLKSSWFGTRFKDVEFPENGGVMGRRIVPCLLPDGWPQWLL